jgi:periplasmic mercuric ion binding protein
MKKLKWIFLSLGCALLTHLAFAQDSKTDTIKVYGNCGMCKTTIESSLKKKDGVLSKSWNKDTKILKVTYDPSKITVQKIGEKVAAVGYDNEYATAPDAAYNNLHHCCQYDRPKGKK